MNRRAFLKRSGAAALLPLCPRGLLAGSAFRRRRPSDADWPSKEAWKRLNDAVGGNLISIDFPLIACTRPESPTCKDLFEDLRNPYYIGDQAGVTQTLGWVDAWATKPSVYAVAATNAGDVAAAVNFARENDLRLVVKGGGHSYQGTSNAPDSLLIWTRHMRDIRIHADFIPRGCEGTHGPQRAVTLGAGTIWMQAYTPSPQRAAHTFKAAAARQLAWQGSFKAGASVVFQSTTDLLRRHYLKRKLSRLTARYERQTSARIRICFGRSKEAEEAASAR